MLTPIPPKPTRYSDQLASLLCAHVANGKSLRQICAMDDMPELCLVAQWLLLPGYASFRQKYHLALQVRAELMADELACLALDEEKPLAWTKLQVDTRKWLIAKFHPRRFGSKPEWTAETDETGNELVFERLTPEEGILLNRLIHKMKGQTIEDDGRIGPV